MIAYRVDYAKGEFQGFGFAGVYGKAANFRADDGVGNPARPALRPEGHARRPVRRRCLLHPRRLDGAGPVELRPEERGHHRRIRPRVTCAPPSGGACRPGRLQVGSALRDHRASTSSTTRRTAAACSATTSPTTATASAPMRRGDPKSAPSAPPHAGRRYNFNLNTTVQGRVPHRPRQPARLRGCEGWQHQQDQPAVRRLGAGLFSTLVLAAAAAGVPFDAPPAAPRGLRARCRPHCRPATPHEQARPDWHAAASALHGIDGRAFIGGQRLSPLPAARPSPSLADRRPHAGATSRRGRAADIDAAVAWPAPPSPTRAGPEGARGAQGAAALAEKIRPPRRTSPCSETWTWASPSSTALAVDVGRHRAHHRLDAEAVDKIYDEIAPTAASALALITREPMGVIGVVVPWNYPDDHGRLEAGPRARRRQQRGAQAQREEPAHRLRLAELAIEAGLPEGVFNVVPGYGHEAGEALALHMDVDAIGFTGSTRVGRKMLEYAGRSNLKRVYNELGGKSAFVVFDDFAHVERAAKTVAGSMFFNQGELQRALARAGAREGGGPLSKRSPPRRRIRAGRPRLGPRRDGRAGRRDADEDRARLHRGRQQRRREAGHRRQRARASRPAASTCSPPCSRRAQRHENRPRGDLRPGDERDPLWETKPRPLRWPTTPATAWAGQRGATTSTARTAWRARCAPAPCTSTSTTKTTSPCPSAATSRWQRPRQEPARLRQVHRTEDDVAAHRRGLRR